MFAGIGGFRAGLDRAGGFQCVGHCENDKYAEASYRAIHDIREEERYYPDARKIDPSDLPDFDLLCGGFPCQSYSMAGLRLGLSDPEELSFLKFPDWLKQNDLRICCSKMFPVCYRMTKERRLRPSSPRWGTWGIMSSGLCLTAPIITSRRQESECTLSDILIPDAPEKYFLSSAMVEKLLYNSSEGHKVTASTTQEELPAPRPPGPAAPAPKQGCT